MTALRFMVGIAAAIGLMSSAGLANAQQKYTEWGWPLPYEKISDKSVNWLKEKGWWPLTVAWQAPWSGQNTVNVVTNREGLLAKRGIDAAFQAFNAGSEINEVVSSGRAQVGSGGNFPFTSLLDNRIPVKALAILSPNLEHATLVPLNSKLKSLKDMKGSNPPVVVGIATGSSGEFYFQEAAKANGVVIGKDVIQKNMSIPDQMLLPQGLDAVVPWELAISIMVDEKKTARRIDTIFPYNFYEGNYYVRQEIIDNAPDVAQALSDAYMEAVLWIRLHPQKAADYLLEEPRLKNYGKALLLQQTELYNNLYKPTSTYPHAQFWATENERIAKWLFQTKRLRNELAAKDYVAAFDTRYMDKTYEKLGWKVPLQPSFLPKDWKGQVGKTPYPEYYNARTLTKQQPWPEAGDLTKPWQFAGKAYTP